MEQNSDTLIMKHLPSVLNNEEKEDLLKHFGALEVKCISSKEKKYNVVFARFENGHIAETVLHRLHQINVLGSRIAVEFAKEKLEPQLPKFKEPEIGGETEDEKYYKQFIDKLNSWHSSLDFRQPVPNHLRYQYPPPDDLTLSNITKLLATIPKFYTQVLHLMNKMNLPCPFGKEILPDLNIYLTRPEVVENVPEIFNFQVEEKNAESTESELSSDEETGQQKETIPERPKIQKKKQIKVPKFVKPVAVQVKEKKKKTTFEEVFEKVDENEPKKIKLSHPQQFDLVGKKVGESSKEVEEVGGFGFIHPVNKPEEKAEEIIDVRDEREEERLEKEEIICISKEELAANRLSEKDRAVLPVFKNYAEGAPTCRLYVKNLSKTVTDQDLRFIYSRFLTREVGEDPNIFDIRLMQEGRMKGQAFITLQSIELAQAALKETNGYILKDKPLVVQFARSATK